MDNLISFLIAAAIIGSFLYFHLRKEKKKHAAAKAAAEKGKIRSDGPQSQHPHIDNNYCIGCATCTMVCPEGDVLGMVGGKAMIINGYKCIGHSLCAEACPVGAITMVLASPSVGANLATLTPAYETTVKNMFIVGELGGLALIKNAVNQGRDCVDTMATRLTSSRSASPATRCLRHFDCWCRPRRHQRFPSRRREKAELHHFGRIRNRRHCRQISAPETGHDQPRRISHAWKVQEDRTLQGRIA